MATTINADTSTGGAIVTGDASGVLALQAAGSTQVTINGSGVVLANPLPVGSGGTGATSLSGITAGSATNLAGGSAGTVPYQSAAGTTAMLAAGSSGQVLTSSGAGAPSWTTPSAGALVYISSQTVTSPVSAVDFTSGFSSTYDDYVILFENIVAESSAVTLQLRIYKNSSLITTSSYRYQRISSSATTTSSQSSTSANTSDFGPAQSTSYTFGRLEIYNANSNRPSFLSRLGIAGAETAIWEVAMTNTANNSFTGLSIYDNNAYNIVSGTFRLYGVAKS